MSDIDAEEDVSVDGYERVCAEAKGTVEEYHDDDDVVPADATPAEAVMCIYHKLVRKMQGIGPTIVRNPATQRLVKYYVHIFFCSYGGVVKGEGVRLAQWIIDQITSKISGKVSVDFYMWMVTKVPGMLRNTRQELNKKLADELCADFNDSGLDLEAYKHELFKDTARQRKLVVNAIRSCSCFNRLQTDWDVPKWQQDFAHSKASIKRWQKLVVKGCHGKKEEDALFLFKALNEIYGAEKSGRGTNTKSSVRPAKQGTPSAVCATTPAVASGAIHQQQGKTAPKPAERVATLLPPSQVQKAPARPPSQPSSSQRAPARPPPPSQSQVQARVQPVVRAPPPPQSSTSRPLAQSSSSSSSSSSSFSSSSSSLLSSSSSSSSRQSVPTQARDWAEVHEQSRMELELAKMVKGRAKTTISDPVSSPAMAQRTVVLAQDAPASSPASGHVDIGVWRVADAKKWVRRSLYSVCKLQLRSAPTTMSFMVPVGEGPLCKELVTSSEVSEALCLFFKTGVRASPAGFSVAIPPNQRADCGGWAKDGFTFYVGKNLKQATNKKEARREDEDIKSVEDAPSDAADEDREYDQNGDDTYYRGYYEAPPHENNGDDTYNHGYEALPHENTNTTARHDYKAAHDKDTTARSKGKERCSSLGDGEEEPFEESTGNNESGLESPPEPDLVDGSKHQANEDVDVEEDMERCLLRLAQVSCEEASSSCLTQARVDSDMDRTAATGEDGAHALPSNDGGSRGTKRKNAPASKGSVAAATKKKKATAKKTPPTTTRKTHASARADA